MKTYTPRPAEAEQRWWVVDAEGQILGRIASEIARVLRGKHKPRFAPHMDMGDYVVVVNAEKIAVTGNRLTKKLYYNHSGYPGGLRTQTLEEVLAKYPDRALRLAVKGMLPRGRLGRQVFGKLKVYAGPDHPHAAQCPERWIPGTIPGMPASADTGKEGL